MHDPPRAELGDKEGEERLEEQVMQLEEVAGPHVLGVIPDEGSPRLAGQMWRTRLTDVTLDGPLGDLDVQLEQLTLNSISTPQPIVCGHVLDQRDRLGWDLRFLFRRTRFPLPEQAEALTMPMQHRFRLDDEQGIFIKDCERGGAQEHPPTVGAEGDSRHRTSCPDPLKGIAVVR